ncbi:MAG TPA: DUF2066 domain-containing protein [Dongiaceae bacterium]|nr:DUF2066 domain-containing protein [Dongiaceae bacterium]
MAALLALPTAGLTGAAWAQAGAVYTATGIDVDVTGDIATLRDQALLQGQRLGLQKVLTQIAPADRVQSLTLPSDDVISTWVQDFEIEQEKASATHYIGRFTFRFLADPVQQFLAGNNVAFAQAQTKRVLVLPVYTDETGNSTLWGPANLLLLPWGAKAPNASLVPLVLPSGDISDSTSLSATQALAGDTQRLAAMAQRYGAAEVMVTEVKAAPVGPDGMQSFAVAATRYGRGATTQFSDTVSGDPATMEALLGQTVDHTINWVQGQVREANMVDATRQTAMMVDVPLTSLRQWVDIKKQLGGVPSLKSVRLVSLTKAMAVLDISFLGDVPHFQRALAQQDLALDLQAPNKGLLRQDSSAHSGGLPEPAPMPAPAPAPTDDSYLAPSEPVVPPQPAVPQ